MLTRNQINDQLLERGAIANVGQIEDADVRALNKAAKEGRLVKYRGYWNTLLPFAGIGPLKTCWCTPEVAAALYLTKEAA